MTLSEARREPAEGGSANCPCTAGLPGSCRGEQDGQKLSLGSGQQKPTAGRSQGMGHLHRTHLSLQDWETASTLAGSHSKQGQKDPDQRETGCDTRHRSLSLSGSCQVQAGCDTVLPGGRVASKSVHPSPSISSYVSCASPLVVGRRAGTLGAREGREGSQR